MRQTIQLTYSFDAVVVGVSCIKLWY